MASATSCRRAAATGEPTLPEAVRKSSGTRVSFPIACGSSKGRKRSRFRAVRPSVRTDNLRPSLESASRSSLLTFPHHKAMLLSRLKLF